MKDNVTMRDAITDYKEKLDKFKNNSITVKDVASILNLPISTARYLCKKERLSKKINGKVYVSKTYLNNYLKTLTNSIE